MARTSVSPVAAVGPYPTLPVAANALDVAFVASDAANGNQIAFGSYNRLLILARNTGAGAQTVTLTSAADGLNRTGDIAAYSLGANEFAAFQVTRNGWRQSDGYVYVDASDAAILLLVFGLNN